MQQTAFDRRLKHQFVYYTQVFCNTLPRALPEGVSLEETTPEMGSLYLYRISVPNDRLLSEVTARLEVENITYTSRVVEKEGIRRSTFGNPNKSFTMQVAWTVFFLIVLGVILSGLPGYLWRTLSA